METLFARMRSREAIRDSTAGKLFPVLSASFPRTLKYSGTKLTTVLRGSGVIGRGTQECEATQQGGRQENKDPGFICSPPTSPFLHLWPEAWQLRSPSLCELLALALTISLPGQRASLEGDWKLPAFAASHTVVKIKKINIGNNQLKKFLNKCK